MQTAEPIEMLVKLEWYRAVNETLYRNLKEKDQKLRELSAQIELQKATTTH